MPPMAYNNLSPQAAVKWFVLNHIILEMLPCHIILLKAFSYHLLLIHIDKMIAVHSTAGVTSDG